MFKNSHNNRSNDWNLKKELKRRGYWSRKNTTKSRVLEAKLNICEMEKHRLQELNAVTLNSLTLVAKDLLENSHKLVQELYNSHKQRDQIVQTCEGIIMDLKIDLQKAREQLVHEHPVHEIQQFIPIIEVKKAQDLVHELPVHENREQQFMIIPIQEKRLGISYPRQFFGLNPHKRMHVEFLFSKRKKGRTK